MNLKTIFRRGLLLTAVITSLYLFSCSLSSPDKFTDVSFFSPKLLPGSDKIVMLKNIRVYTQTGTIGGVNDDELSTDWFLLEYDIATGKYATTALNEITFTPFWMRHGITSATDSCITIFGGDRSFFVNLNTHSQKAFPPDIFLIDACFDPETNTIVQIKSSGPVYSLFSLDVNSGAASELLKLDRYYANISIPPVPMPKHYFLSYSSIAVVNTSDWSLKVSPGLGGYVCAYDSDKVAVLSSSNTVSLFTVNADTLESSATVALAQSGVVNFSVNKSMKYMVYQIDAGANGDLIVLRNLATNSEATLFANTHHRD